jgi:hypothetical protein
MRKLIAVGVLVGGLLAGAGGAQAATVFLPNQGGIGDPLTLAASGVLLPYITSGPIGTVALLEIVSPVGDNSALSGNPLHLVFYDASCVRAESLEVEVTDNGTAFVDFATHVPALSNGLVAIGGNVGSFPGGGVGLMNAPLHTRMFEFNPIDGRSRILEPIIVDTAEFGVGTGFNQHIFSPLRTAATFFIPRETATVNSQVTLICPRTTIQGAALAAFGADTGSLVGLSSSGFPLIVPPFHNATGGLFMGGNIYDEDENFIHNITFRCDCLTPDKAMIFFSPSGAYAGALAANGTYTEIQVVQALAPELNPGSFTGYKATFTVGSPLNNFFGRLSNGNFNSILGTGAANAPGNITNAR